jgi:hypothetical protein
MAQMSKEKIHQMYMIRRKFYIPKTETTRYYGSIKGDREPTIEEGENGQWQ